MLCYTYLVKHIKSDIKALISEGFCIKAESFCIRADFLHEVRW